MNYLILALATWRLSSLLSIEDGPYDIFDRLRAYVGIWYDDYSIAQSNNELARMLKCVWCVSVWIGVLMTVVYWLLGDVVIWLVLPLALSAAAIAINGRVATGWNAGDS